MQKAYSRITWHNKPSTQTPLDETNLNKMDLALDTVDDRVIALDTGKANSSDLLTAVKSVVLNPTTGVLTITQMDNTSTTYDTALEKVAVNFDYDDDPTSQHYENLIITLEDGSYKYVDLSALITEYEFENSDTIAPSVVGGKVSMSIRNGSIDNSMLKSSFLVDIRAAQAAAEGAASNASGSATAAAADALLAESHNHGNTGARDNEDTDNAMYYKNQANILGQAQAKNAEAWANGTRDGQAVPSTDPAYHNNGAYWAGQANTLGAAQKLEAQAWAEGMRGTTPVSQGDDQYNNNAKYWAGQAQQAAGGGVTSFNNRTANVIPMAGDYDKTMVGLGNVDNTSDLNKPVSNAQQTALNAKVPKSDIAPTEVSPSTHAYKQGDIFYYNGILYKAKTAIAVDDVLTVGTNIETTTISATSGGHVIVDESGNLLTQRSKLQFLNAEVTDDEENDTTIINPQGGTTIVAPPTVVVGTYTYNGSPQGPTITWDTGMSDYCVVTNATQTDAGSYQLTIALKNTAKMVWNDGASGLSTADKIYNYSIAKANQTITLSSNSVTLDPNNLTATVTVSGAQGVISATTSDNTIATASVSSSTVTISNVNEASGSATITITAAATANYNSDSDTVTVTASFSPNGSTVTPTDDIQTWLKCGDISDKNYTTLNQVLSDTSTLSALISDSNAVDYMVRSTTWATDTCSNQTAMSYIGLNNYCSNTLLDDSTWLNAICNSTYFESVLNAKVPTMTSDTTPSGEVIYNDQSTESSVWYRYVAWHLFDANINTYWGIDGVPNFNSLYVGYVFTNSVSVKKIMVACEHFVNKNGYTGDAISEYQLQGSSDGSTWSNIGNPVTLSHPSATDREVVSSTNAILNSNSYRWYRLRILNGMPNPGWMGGREIQLYGRQNV